MLQNRVTCLNNNHLDNNHKTYDQTCQRDQKKDQPDAPAAAHQQRPSHRRQADGEDESGQLVYPGLIVGQIALLLQLFYLFL